MTLNECDPWFMLLQKVTRRAWNIGVFVKLGFAPCLTIHTPDGKQKAYIPSDEDIVATDWYAPGIDDPGFYCHWCGEKIQHDDPVVLIYPMDDMFKTYIRHKNCEVQI